METRDAIIKAIIAYLEDDIDLLNRCMEELDSYNGYLGDNRWYDMCELGEAYSNTNPIELLNLAFFGYDEDSWTINARGERVYGAFNPNRNYFAYDGYGNLVSSDYIDYTGLLDKWAVIEMCGNRVWIDAINNDNTLSGLFDRLDGSEG